MTTLLEVALELYGLPTGEFTPTRTARAKEARAGGDRDLAAAITTLRRPTTAAWAVNLLVRERPDEVGGLLELGSRLLEAQAALAGEELRTLNRQQHQVMAAVVRQAAGLAADAGQRVSDAVAGKVEGTLRAAMSDPDAAAVVLSGLLVTDLESTGLEPVDVTGALAVEDAPPMAGAPRRPTPARLVASGGSEDGGGRPAADERRAEQDRRAADQERRRRDAQEQVRVAQKAADAADDARAEAEEAQAELEGREGSLTDERQALTEQIETLTGRLHAVTEELRAVTKDARRARGRRGTAEEAATTAHERLARARRELERLED